jgi:hypothetical protein
MLQRLQESDQHAAALQAGELVSGRALDLQNQVDIVNRVRIDPRPRRLIAGIGKSGSISGSWLDEHLEPQAGHSLYGIGRSRDAPLRGLALLRNRHLHSSLLLRARAIVLPSAAGDSAM